MEELKNLFQYFRVLGAARHSLLMLGVALTLPSFFGCYGEQKTNERAAAKAPPSQLRYSSNPANFTAGVEATPVTLSYSGALAHEFRIEPAVPAGLEFNPATATISGTPLQITPAAEYRVTAVNSYGSTFMRLTLAVNDDLPTIQYADETPLVYTVGTGIVPITPTLGGGATLDCISVPPLPTGLELSASCELSGTPLEAKPQTIYLISALNSGGGASLPLDITVKDLPPEFTYVGAPASLFRGVALTEIEPTTVNGGGVIVACASVPALPDGLSLSADCKISGTPSVLVPVAKDYVITATNSGGSFDRTLNFNVVDKVPDISYTGSSFIFKKNIAITALTVINTGGTIDSCAVAPALPAGLQLSASTCKISGIPGVPVASATYVVTATNTGGSKSTSIDIFVKDSPPTLLYIGSPYSFSNRTLITAVTPSNTGGTITSCSASPELPAGLALAAGTCEISGTPTVASALNTYVITAANTGGTATATIKIKVNEIPPVLSFSNAPFTYFKAVPIAPELPVNTGGPVSSCVSAPSLPAGLILGANCEISGIPAVILPAANYSISGTNSAGTSTQAVNITVKDTPPSISFVGSPYIYVKNSAITTLSPANTGGVVVSCVANPNLPNGLTLSSTCSISGTPTEIVNAADYVITGTNSGGDSSATINIQVNDQPPAFVYVGSPFSFTQNALIAPVTPNSTGGTVVSCAATPDLPAGLVLSATCGITGTPTALSAATGYTITGTNTGGSSSQVISIAVKAAVPVLSYAVPSHVLAKGDAIAEIQATTAGGGAIVTCSAVPPLPTGLTLAPTTCHVTGTPTVIQVATDHLITATNTGGSAVATLRIAVNDKIPILTYADPYSFTKGDDSGTQTPGNTGGTIVSCSAAPALPAGLSLSNVCVLTGIPTVISAATDYTISATNSGGIGTVSINIEIKDDPPVLTYADSPFTYTKGELIPAVTAINGGGAIASCASSPVLPAGLTLSAICGISGTPSVLAPIADYVITATNSGGSSSATVEIAVNAVAPAITYSGSPNVYVKDSAIIAWVAANTGGAIVSCASAPALPAGLSVGADCTISGTPTALSPAAEYVITATNTGGTSAATVNITVKDLAPVIGYTGSPYTYVLGSLITPLNVENTGGAIVSCVASPALPAGLALSATCGITGTPSALAPAADYVITATNTGGNATATIRITVKAVAPAISYAGTPFTYTLGSAIAAAAATNTGGTIVSCTSAPALPAGLSLAANCTISGTPAVLAPAADYVITATNTGGTGSATINIKVEDVTPVVSYVGSPFSYTLGSGIAPLAVVNTGGPIISCSSAPALPAGLSLSATCGLTGTPSVLAVAADYVISATNTGGTGTATISIAVKAVAPAITYSGSPNVYVKDSAITTWVAANTGGAIVSCASAPVLPAGLSVGADCTISGTPTALSPAADYVITATNTGGTSAATVNITVKDVIPAISYVGSPFTYTLSSAIAPLAVVNSGGTIVSCTSSPALPAGLALSATCGITGTPSALVPAADYVITGTNTGGNATATIRITVKDVAPAISYAGTPFTYTLGSAIAAAAATNTGGTIVSCTSAPALPAGLSLAANCTISGTPAVLAPAADYVITATNTGGTGSATINIKVEDVAPSLTYAAGPHSFALSALIANLTPTNLGGPIVSCSSDIALPVGLSLSAGCVLSGTPLVLTPAADYVITATNTGGTASATLNLAVKAVAPAITYSGSPNVYVKDSAITTWVAANTGGAIVSCASAPVLPAGLSVGADCTISGTPTALSPAADYVITATNTGGTSTATVNIRINDAPPTLAYVGGPFSYTLGEAIDDLLPTNIGGTIASCSAVPALPNGLALSDDCEITGLPLELAPASGYVVTATNSGGSVATSVNISVVDQAPDINYIPSAYSFTYTKGVAIAALTPNNLGGAITSCTASAVLPPGLALSNVCALSGTPSAIRAAANFTITATNSGGSSAQVIELIVNDAAPVFNYGNAPYTFAKGAAVSETPLSTGGAIVSCLSNPVLPAGLSLSNTCEITGTPSTVSDDDYDIIATNTGGTQTETIHIAVENSAPQISYAGGPFVYTKNSAVVALTPGNAGGDIVSCASVPGLPAGLSLSNDCVLSGTPNTVAAADDYVITATNAEGTSDATIWITVKDLAPAIGFAPNSKIYGLRTLITPLAPTNTGGAITSCSSNPLLPAGLSLSAACELTGTPTATSVGTLYTITSENSGGTSSAGLTITVKDQLQILFSSLSDISEGAPFNGTAPGSENIWKISVDGQDRVPLTQISGGLRQSIVPTVSADGTRILYCSKRSLDGLVGSVGEAAFNTWTSDTAGGSLEPVTGDPGTGDDSDDDSPQFSPDGTKIVFASKGASGVATASYNVFVKDLSSGVLTSITANTLGGLDSVQPTFSPDGTLVYFASKADIDRDTDGAASLSYNIWSSSLDGSDRKPLTIQTAGGFDSIEPAVSPDGSKVVYSSKEDIGLNPALSFNIWVMDANGDNPEPLTNEILGNRDSQSPKYSSDGSKIVFSSRKNVNNLAAQSYNIWKMDSDGLNPAPLTEINGANQSSFAPQFSPDGAYIAFHSRMDVGVTASDSYNIWVIKTTGLGLNHLTGNTTVGFDSLLGSGRIWFQP